MTTDDRLRDMRRRDEEARLQQLRQEQLAEVEKTTDAIRLIQSDTYAEMDAKDRAERKRLAVAVIEGLEALSLVDDNCRLCGCGYGHHAGCEVQTVIHTLEVLR